MTKHKRKYSASFALSEEIISLSAAETSSNVNVKNTRISSLVLASSHSTNIRPSPTKLSHEKFTSNLPVYEHRKQIVECVRQNSVVLITAETGSGKTTQVAKFLHESGITSSKSSRVHKNGRAPMSSSNSNSFYYLGRTVAVTQPRRVAAMSIAKRVAEEMGCEVGTTCGYRVRFDDCSDYRGTNTTRILYVTDGMLLREAMTDPLLSRYAVVVLDEAHERSLQTDILFGVVKRAMNARASEETDDACNTFGAKGDDEKKPLNKDQQILQAMKIKAKQLNLPSLKVVVMSATMDVSTFSTFFPFAVSIHIPGRTFPVQILYAKEAQDDYIDSTVSTVLQIIEEGDEGGQEEITDAASLLKSFLNEEAQFAQSIKASESNPGVDVFQNVRGYGTNLDNAIESSVINGVLVCVLYAALPPETQMIAFQPRPKGCNRKVILSTNIAETSITVEGIKYVVDAGKHKMREFNGITGMESLSIADISKAQATQRAGRAGRTSSGFCLRLYTEDSFHNLSDAMSPEILRLNLAQVVLQLKGMGMHDPRYFDFLTPPSTEGLLQAFDLLFILGALDKLMSLTEHGKKMAKFPLDPTFAHLLLQSPKYGCTKEILTAVSMLSTENLFYLPGRGLEETGKSVAAKAADCHRRFKSHEGDLPTQLAVYRAWKREAMYTEPSAGGRSTKKKLQAACSKSDGLKKIPHGDWCKHNFINGKALSRAQDIRSQIADICTTLGWDSGLSCGNELEPFLKCVCAGLFLKVATRLQSNEIKSENISRKSSDPFASRGKYRTKIGGQEVFIHPSSVMFGRNPAPKAVVFTELLVTTKTYIRGVTQILESWLPEVAPSIFEKE